MSNPDFVIPAERLPAGFAESVEKPVLQPAEPRPAATVVLLRDGASALEVLLLKRHRASGFVPGAYVFPGGRTDEADAERALLEHATDLRDCDVPEHYWFAAVREVFEETGVLLARDERGAWVPDTSREPRLEQLRLTLMDDGATLLDVVQACQCRIDFGDVVYFAHWITPIPEPRRYDTRFFAARLPEGRMVRPDPREMTDALWLTPKDALTRFAAGRLPMVFPTVRTLEQLAEYRSVAEALEALRSRDVEPVMPRLVRTESGVGIVIDPK
ncbi:MAG TPA: NUDIX domain-containing protein [Longimicrobiales bacterium]